MEGPLKVRSDWDARIWIDGAGEAERRLEVTPAIAGWDLLSFRTYTFRANQVIEGESATDEMAMVLLSGSLTLSVAGRGWQETWACAGRSSVFDGRPPYAVYLPPGHTYSMTVHRDADCAYGRAPAAGARPPRLIRPEEMESAGERGGVRTLHVLTADMTEHLRCAETIIPAGTWAFVAAARPEREGAIEQVSYYRTRPDTGWGMQRLPDPNGSNDQALIVEHGDAVIMRSGACPVVSAPDTALYCLNYLAGPGLPGGAP